MEEKEEEIPKCCGTPMMAVYRYKEDDGIYQDFVCGKMGCHNKVTRRMHRTTYEKMVRIQGEEE